MALPGSLQCVRVDKPRVGADHDEVVTLAFPNLLLSGLAELCDLPVFPCHDLSEKFFRHERFDPPPATPPGMMHLVDGLEHGFRWHAAGIDAQRGALGLRAHEE